MSEADFPLDEWRSQLEPIIHDPSARGTLLSQIAQQVDQAILGQGLAPEHAKLARKKVIATLLAGFARPTRSAPDARPELTDVELEDLVGEKFPYSIATCFERMLKHRSPASQFGCLLDTFECLLRFLATVLLGAYWRRGADDSELNRHILEILCSNKPLSTGHVLRLVRETALSYLNRPDDLPYPQLIRVFFKHGKPTRALSALEALLELRNMAWGHSGVRSDRVFGELLPQGRQLLLEALRQCCWLGEHSLWAPTEVDETGQVRQAYLLNGARFRSPRPVHLQLLESDRESVESQREEMLLLVDSDRGSYLPLFPISLFHLPLSGQGVYFVSELRWRTGTSLQAAHFISHDLEHLDDRGRPIPLKVERGQPAVRNLEENIGRILDRLEGASPARPAPRRDYDLAEVWEEQRTHRNHFVGREAVLDALADWLGKTPQGYLLLLGPPGQGKSALLAELAARQGALLHMVKSCGSPIRFLQFLLWQGYRLLDQEPPPYAFEGDLDELRDQLVKLLGHIVSHRGQAVLVLDALDELEADPGRLRFLPQNLGEGVRVVLSCRPDIPLVEALKQRLAGITVKTLQPLGLDEMPRLVSSFLRDLPGSDQIDLKALYDRTGGSPLFLRRGLEQIQSELASARTEGRSPVLDLGRLPNTVAAVFRSIYDEIRQGTHGPTRARLVKLLSISAETLNLKDLRDLLALESPISREETRDRVAEFSRYLLIYNDHFLLFHKGFSDYILEEVLDPEDRASLNRLFFRWLESTRQRESEYRLRHLPLHLVEWVRWSVLAETGETSEALELLLERLSDMDFTHSGGTILGLDEAARLLQDRDPISAARCWFEVARIHYLQENNPEGSKALSQVDNLLQEHPEAMVWLVPRFDFRGYRGRPDSAENLVPPMATRWAGGGTDPLIKVAGEYFLLRLMGFSDPSVIGKMESAVQILEERAEPEARTLLVLILHRLAMAHEDILGDTQTATTYARRSIEVAGPQGTGRNYGWHRAWHHYVGIKLRLGQFSEASGLLASCVPIVERLGNNLWLREWLGMWGGIAEGLGDLDEAARVHRRHLELGELAGAAGAIVWASARLALVEVKRGFVDRAEEIMAGLDSRPALAGCLRDHDGLLARICLLGARRDAAGLDTRVPEFLQGFESLMARAGSKQVLMLRGRLFAELAVAYHRSGRTHESQEYAGQARQAFQECQRDHEAESMERRLADHNHPREGVVATPLA